MFKENFLKEKLKKNKVVVGTWSVVPSEIVTDIIASSGIDFIIIDSEHGPMSFETAQRMCIACESRGVSPVMRVGSVNESDVLRCLDIGVHGVQLPNISCKEDLLKLVRYSKFPPVGERGFSPFTRAGNYSIETAKKFPQIANDNGLIIINIEDLEGIDNLDLILEVEELDIVFVGLYDLSKAMGRPGEVEHPEVINKLDQITKKVIKANKVVGTIATTPDQAQQFIDMGMKYIVYLVDCEMIRQSYTNVLGQLKR